MPWEDSIVALIVVLLLIFIGTHFAARGICRRKGHAWERRFDHRTQRERFRCGTCEKWEGDDFP